MDIAKNAGDFVAMAKRLVDATGIKSPPIDPLMLARLRGIHRVLISRALTTSGQLSREGTDLIIKLNAIEPRERQNFTCCHEIAHTFVIDGSLMNCRALRIPVQSVKSAEERLCDLAAAEMLMPEKFFLPMMASLEPSIESVVGLAKKFASSIRATVLRLGQLAVWPVVFLGWRFTTRPGSVPKLRVAWSVRPTGSRCFVPLHAPAPRGSGVHATFTASHPTCETEDLDLGSLRGKYLVESARFGQFVVSIVYDPKLKRRDSDGS